MDHELHDRKGSLILAAGKILFGTTAIAVRLIPVHVFVFLLAIHLGGIVGFLKPAYREIKTLSSRQWWVIGGVSFAFLVQDFTYYAAVKMMDVSIATLLRWIAPVLVVCFAPLMGTRTNRQQALATVIAAAGLFILLVSKGVAYGSANLTGIIFVLISALSVAIYWMSAKIVLREVSSSLLLAIRSIMALPVILLVLVLGFKNELVLAIPFLPHLVAFGLLYGIIAGYLDTAGIQRIGMQEAAILGYLVPLTTVVLSIALLREPFGLGIGIGGILILAGGYLATKSRYAQSTNP